MDLNDVHEDRPLRWPIRLGPPHRQTIYRLVDEGMLPDGWLATADRLRLDSIDDVRDLHADLGRVPGIGEFEELEDDLFRSLARIDAIWQRGRGA